MVEVNYAPYRRDGQQGWAVSGVGAVGVSDDPLEFYRIMARGPLAGRRDGEKKAQPGYGPVAPAAYLAAKP